MSKTREATLKPQIRFNNEYIIEEAIQSVETSSGKTRGENTKKKITDALSEHIIKLGPDYLVANAKK